MKKRGKIPVNQDRGEMREVDDLECMARSRTDGETGPLRPVGWITALTFILFGGIAVAAFFFAPGFALASALAAIGTGVHPWIVDGGGEVANNATWRPEIVLEYIAAGLAVIIVSLRVGKAVLTKLQDWYEVEPPRISAEPLVTIPPAVVIPRPRHAVHAKVARRDRRRLHAA